MAMPAGRVTVIVGHGVVPSIRFCTFFQMAVPAYGEPPWSVIAILSSSDVVRNRDGERAAVTGVVLIAVEDERPVL